MTASIEKIQLSELAETSIRHSSSNHLPTISRNWMEVSDIMTKNIATVSLETSIVSAAKIMSDKNISCIIVLDNGDVSGIITETDFLKRAVADENGFLKMAVEQVMSTPVRSLSHNLSILEASRIMEAEKIRRLIVLEDELLAGIITQTDKDFSRFQRNRGRTHSGKEACRII